MLIEATTAAATKTVSLNPNSTLQVRGVLGTDVIAIEIPNGAGGWKSLKEGGEVVQLDTDNEQLTSFGHTLVRINKPSTTNSVGVSKIG